jgi:hypothetical protein
MITEDTIVYNKGTHIKEDYTVQAFVIDGEVVDIFAIPKTFLQILNDSNLVEKNFEDGRYYIDAVKDNNVIEQISVPEKIGAILLSDPLLVELSIAKNNYQVVPGMKYVDGLVWSN